MFVFKPLLSNGCCIFVYLSVVAQQRICVSVRVRAECENLSGRSNRGLQKPRHAFLHALFSSSSIMKEEQVSGGCSTHGTEMHTDQFGELVV
jgi:hypothetical protein